MRKREQVSVPLDPQLREYVGRMAVREDRSLAGQIVTLSPRPPSG
jgi:hypothetical protein